MTSADLARLWPAAGVRARAGDLELRWLDDELLLAIADVASRGVHGDDPMPFSVPWTRGTSEDVARSVLAYQWTMRSQVGPRKFTLEFGVLVDGRPVGTQGASGSDWPALRTAETGSWLGREFQGRGIGTRMRVLMLHLLFGGLGAAGATSAAFADNPASNAVSRKAGYLENGVGAVARDGAAVEQQRYLMARERWVGLRDEHAAILGAPVELEGVDALRAQLEG